MKYNNVKRIVLAGCSLVVSMSSFATPPPPSREEVENLARKIADKTDVKITNQDLDKAQKERERRDQERAQKERDRKSRENQRREERNGTGLR
jgi:hypothetical protein